MSEKVFSNLSGSAMVLTIAIPTAVSAGSSDNANVGGQPVLAKPGLSSIPMATALLIYRGGPKDITDVEINGTGFSTDSQLTLRLT